jgi:hypothetical protein
VLTNVTYLPDDQVAWLANVMSTANGRGTILLSHHQLYSGAGSVGQSAVNGQTVNWGINPQLFPQVEPYFSDISVWLWGHEHNTVIFNPQNGVPLGRCIGSGAIPMLVAEDPYTPAPGLSGVGGIPVPTMNLGYELGNNGTDYYHGFAMLALSSTEATVTYYQLPIDAGTGDSPTATVLFTESFGVPTANAAKTTAAAEGVLAGSPATA